MIEAAYQVGEAQGLAVWTEDEAGPYQTRPIPGHGWRPVGEPAHYPHEYLRNGTAKVLTLFHPRTGMVRVAGVTQSTNAVLHPWLKAQLSAILATLLPPVVGPTPAEIRAVWERWQEGLSVRITLPDELPPLRMLLILDNLTGHYTPDFVLWLFDHGILPLYTPLGGSWLNLAESIQRILKRRALDGQHPQSAQEIIDWWEATARAWNREPTPFIWGGKRAQRRARSWARGHRLGGSGGYTTRPVRRRLTVFDQWQSSSQMTH